MKLLIVMNNMGEGGAQKSLVNMLQLIPPHYYDIDVVLFARRGMFLTGIPQWINVLEPPDSMKYCYKKADKGIFKSFSAFKSALTRFIYTPLYRIKSKGNPDLARQLRWRAYKKVMPKLNGKYDAAMAFMHGEPIYYLIDKVNADKKIGWVHNDYRSTGYDARLDLPYFSKLDSIVTISDECLEILKSEFNEIKHKCVHLPNLISSALIRKMAEEYIPEEYDKNTFVVLSIGRLVEQKGYDFAIKAAALLKKKNIAFHWYIIGTGSLESRLKELCGELDVSDRVSFLGQRSNPYPYIKNADVIAQTSRYEGKSIVLDEAKIIAKPIIATNYNTVYDQLSENEGMVVDMTPESIAEGIAKLLNDSELRKKYSNYLISNNYGNEKLIEKYYKLISGE